MERANVRIPAVDAAIEARPRRRQGRLRVLPHLQRGSSRRASPGDRGALPPWRRGPRARHARQRRRPAQRGGALARASSSRTATSSPRAAARRATRTTRRSGDAIDPRPTVVLVNRDTASAAEILTAALQQNDLATVVGTRTYGKGVFQEVMQLPAGGALDLTIGQYLTADGTSILGEGVKPDVRVEDDPDTRNDGDPDTRRRRGARPRAGRRRRERRRHRRVNGSPTGVRRRRRASAGAFLVAEPLFEPGEQLGLAGGPVRARGGEMVLVERRGNGRAGPRRPRRPGDRPRRLVGADRRAPARAGVRRGDRGRGARLGAARGRDRPDPPRPDRARHVHRRPGDRARLRRRRLGAAGGRRHPPVDPHRRRRRARAPGHRARCRGRAPRDQRLRARAPSSRCCRRRSRPTRAASRRASSGSRSPPRSSSTPTARPARRASTAAGSAPISGFPTTSSTATSPAREAPPELIAAPLELARRAAAALRERRGGAALEVSTTEPEFEFDDEGNVVRAVAVEQTEAHGLIEQLMILTNERVAEVCERRKVPTLYRVHETPDPARIETMFEKLAALGIPTPPLPETISPSQAAEIAGEASRLVSARGRTTRTWPRGVYISRAPFAQTGRLLGPQRRPRRACQPRVLAISRRRFAATRT